MNITMKTLDKAIAEAHRFLEAAEVVKRAAGTEEYMKGNPWYLGGHCCAAVKRASMDLTRALVAVRR